MNAPLSATTRSPEQTRAVGRALGEVLQAGDLIMLRGGLGAGKTTFTQGIGEGMGVRGRVASPTFIVARVHHSLSGGPDLIHADAYRIRDLEDLETLDLDSCLEEAVIVVEWGEGKTEAMSAERRVELRPRGTRWDGVLDGVLARAREIIAEGEAQAFDEGEKTDDAGAESVAPASDE